MSKEKKIYLNERDMPTQWYNIVADMTNKPLPPLHPGTKQPIGPEALATLFPMSLIQQEVTTERWIDIPEEVQDLYKIWRPTPMHRAYNLEKALVSLFLLATLVPNIYYFYELLYSPPIRPYPLL